GFFATMAGSDFSRPCLIGFGSLPFRRGPIAGCRLLQPPDPPVPQQKGAAHSRGSGPPGASGGVAYAAPSSGLPRRGRGGHPEYRPFRGSMAGLRTSLSTLHVRPHDRPRMTRGRCGSLLLHRNGLAPSLFAGVPAHPIPDLRALTPEWGGSTLKQHSHREP